MSKLLNLNTRDFIKGAFMFVVAAVITTILELLRQGTDVDFKIVGISALTAFLTYLLKQFSTDDSGKIGGKF